MIMEDQDILFFYKNEKNNANESNPCFTCYSRKIPEGLNFTKVKIEEDIYFRFHSAVNQVKFFDCWYLLAFQRHYETVSTFIDRIDVINDISGMKDIKLPELALKEKKSYVLMHIRGNPTNMNKMATYTDLRGEMAKFYFEKLRQLSEMGLEPEIYIFFDFYFGKISLLLFLIINNIINHVIAPLNVDIRYTKSTNNLIVTNLN